jgi:1-aminocyclopropane-1-carboxylate deaminase/D-cysteine desulfhydrase-like pyridoxal-dependent ACC family enzyme
VSNGTIFHDLLPSDISWEDLSDVLTPVEQGESGLWYKREDCFAPLGYGGINGSKLRQLIYLMRHMNDGPGVVTACSVLSPQSSMTALVGRHFGVPVTVILGATHYDSAIRHENVRIAVRAGVKLEFIPVAYNPALQRACAAYADKHALYTVPYGITTPPDATPGHVTIFHMVAAPQVVNIPSQIRTLVLPFGSANSATGVLTGLAKYGPGSISRVVLVGIGPDKLAWMWERLRSIGQVLDIPTCELFTVRHRAPSLREDVVRGHGPVLVEHYDLHGTGYVKYSDRRPWRQDGIDFHPTYEGKVMKWLHDEQPHWHKPADGTELFWIVGSEPHLSAMEGKL